MNSPTRLRLGVNIDHVATIRNARGGAAPDPVRAAKMAAEAGADGITAHLREDRRHIGDADIARLVREIDLPLNLEMAMTGEMQGIALKWKPHAVCIVPERREERTTEGGLDAAGAEEALRKFTVPLADAGSRVSFFVEATREQVEASKRCGAQVVELHTGAFCHAAEAGDTAACRRHLEAFRDCAGHAASLGLEVHAGHGLNYETVGAVAAIPQIAELNIGHFLVGEAIFTGFAEAIRRMREAMDAAREGAP